MKSRITLILTGTALLAIALAGCTATATPSAGTPKANTSKAPAASTGNDLATASTSLGTVIVNGKGMTAYLFDKDVAGSGKSACTGDCATLWPAITSTSTTPTVAGVTGKVATIPATGGGNQITVDGHPLYTFSKDTATGSVTGQGVAGIWWVMDASGKAVKKAAGTGTKGGY